MYKRADWQWAQNQKQSVSHGWRPERGFIRYRWLGYNEALILYILGLASPTFPLPASSYREWCSTYQWKKIYGIEFLFGSPMFIHQLSHAWIDFRGIQDAYMRSKSIDYFENSRRATYVQQQYAIRNPKQFREYGEFCWGITASDGPGPANLKVDGISRSFYDYKARGVPWGPDDGTLARWRFDHRFGIGSPLQSGARRKPPRVCNLLPHLSISAERCPKEGSAGKPSRSRLVSTAVIIFLQDRATSR